MKLNLGISRGLGVGVLFTKQKSWIRIPVKDIGDVQKSVQS